MNNKVLQFCLIPLCAVFFNSSVLSATITVTAGQVASVNGDMLCSLSEAIANAETDTNTAGGDCVAGFGSDTIDLPNGVYDIAAAAISDPTYGSSGLPEINSTIIINGAGATVQRAPSLYTATPCSNGTTDAFRLFYVGLVGDLSLNNITLAGGCANFVGSTGAGGAIFNRGIVALNEVNINNNEALLSGGGIQNDATLSLILSTVNNNRVLSGAGGGISSTGPLTVDRSSIETNNASGAGGGINTNNTSSFINSTVGGNSSDGSGGAMYQSNGDSTFIHATIARNQSTAVLGHTLFTASGTLDLGNTLIGESTGNGTNCNNMSNDLGGNLVDDASCTGVGVASVGVGSLSNNGGLARTYLLTTASPAIGTADDTICGQANVGGVDQLGTSRGPVNCDVGAIQRVMAAITNAVPSLGGWSFLLAMALVGVSIRARLNKNIAHTKKQ